MLSICSAEATVIGRAYVTPTCGDLTPAKCSCDACRQRSHGHILQSECFPSPGVGKHKRNVQMHVPTS